MSCPSSLSICPQRKGGNEEIGAHEEWRYQEMGMNEESVHSEEVQPSNAHTEEMVCRSSVILSLQQEDVSKIDPNIPSPFKRALFWSGTKKDNIKGKRMKREKLPAVLSSPRAITYYKRRRKRE